MKNQNTAYSKKFSDVFKHNRRLEIKTDDEDADRIQTEVNKVDESNHKMKKSGTLESLTDHRYSIMATDDFNISNSEIILRNDKSQSFLNKSGSEILISQPSIFRNSLVSQLSQQHLGNSLSYSNKFNFFSGENEEDLDGFNMKINNIEIKEKCDDDFPKPIEENRKSSGTVDLLNAMIGLENNQLKSFVNESLDMSKVNMKKSQFSKKFY